MTTGELHVQAGVWENDSTRSAALFMEGEARNGSNGGGVAFDALYRMVLARGLKVTTDLDHLDRRPVPGWRIRIDDAATVTLEWPGSWPLLMDAPLNLPPGWLRAAGGGLVVVFVGYGLGLHEHRNGDDAPERLRQVAEAGALASGAVPVIDMGRVRARPRQGGHAPGD